MLHVLSRVLVRGKLWLMDLYYRQLGTDLCGCALVSTARSVL